MINVDWLLVLHGAVYVARKTFELLVLLQFLLVTCVGVFEKSCVAWCALLKALLHPVTVLHYLSDRLVLAALPWEFSGIPQLKPWTYRKFAGFTESLNKVALDPTATERSLRRLLEAGMNLEIFVRGLGGYFRCRTTRSKCEKETRQKTAPVLGSTGPLWARPKVGSLFKPSETAHATVEKQEKNSTGLRPISLQGKLHERAQSIVQSKTTPEPDSTPLGSSDSYQTPQCEPDKFKHLRFHNPKRTQVVPSSDHPLGQATAGIDETQLEQPKSLPHFPVLYQGPRSADSAAPTFLELRSLWADRKRKKRA